MMAVCALAPLTVVAQALADQSGKFISPFPRADRSIRCALSRRQLAETLDSSSLVENKTGASGAIGTAFVAKSRPTATHTCCLRHACVNPRSFRIFRTIR